MWPGGSKDASLNDYQKAAYDRVCDVYNAVFCRLTNALSSGVPVTLRDLHTTCVESTAEVLADLLPGESKSSMMHNNKYASFFPHAVSHWLGMDTHDTPLISHTTTISPGACFSIEPGLYFSPEDTNVPKPLRGVGVRLEDDVYVSLLSSSSNFNVVSTANELPIDRLAFEETCARFLHRHED